jgi:hypothetical protein
VYLHPQFHVELTKERQRELLAEARNTRRLEDARSGLAGRVLSALRPHRNARCAEPLHAGEHRAFAVTRPR